jgi:hypothetical protein
LASGSASAYPRSASILLPDREGRADFVGLLLFALYHFNAISLDPIDDAFSG